MKLNVFEIIWYRTLKSISMAPRHILWGLQRLFRGYSDLYIWNFYASCIKEIYPKFKAFVEMEKHGLSSRYFEDPSKLEHNDQDFKKAFETYNIILNKILFAFEFTLYENYDLNKRQRKEFEEKHGNPYDETEENKHERLTYSVIDEETGEKREENLFDEPIYYNSKMLDEFYQRQREGIKLFGEYLLSFWD